MNKHTLTLWLTAATLGVGQVLAQEPPAPPATPPPPPAAAEPVPPAPPKAGADRPQRERGQERPHEPVTYLGIEVESLPDWIGDQLNLPTGFGLLVSYVVPGSPADVAGVKRHDVLKQYNDQMLANPEQLTALVQTGKADQNASLTVLHKGQEAKLTAKLQTRPASEWETGPRRAMGADRHPPRRGRTEDREDEDLDGPPMAEVWRELEPEIRDITRNAQREAAERGREAAQRGREAAERGREAAERGREAAEQARKAQREMMILRNKNGKSTSTRMDLSQGRIVVKDDQGDLEINGGGKDSHLLARDPQGKVTYDGTTKDAPSSLLERVNRFEGNKVRIIGNRIELNSARGSSLDDKDDGDDDAKPTKSSPEAPAAPTSAAPSPGA